MLQDPIKTDCFWVNPFVIALFYLSSYSYVNLSRSGAPFLFGPTFRSSLGRVRLALYLLCNHETTGTASATMEKF